MAATTTVTGESDRAPTAAPPRDDPGQNDGPALTPAPRGDRHPTGDAAAPPRQSPNSSEERSAPDRNGTGGNGGSHKWQHPDGPAAGADQRGNGTTVSVGGVSRLTASQRELVDRVLLACRAAEGRNAVGGYGSSGLTPALLRIAAQLPVGGLAPGSEADTLKPADRFAAKLARLLARQPGRPAEQLAACISDGIRYAFVFDAAAYTEGTMLVHRKLKAQGFDLEARRNQWNSPEYKGVFTRWHDPAHGLPFEVQFHTDESWTVVKRMHAAYVQITEPATPPAERARLRAEQARAEEAVPQPSGWTNIGDLRADAGAAAMPSDVEYYVIVANQRGRAAGLARRKLAAQSGPVDETLGRDLSWRADSAIVEWEYGDLGAELVLIDDQEAENLTQVFRTRWQPS
jgi:hypothetical protein